MSFYIFEIEVLKLGTLKSNQFLVLKIQTYKKTFYDITFLINRGFWTLETKKYLRQEFHTFITFHIFISKHDFENFQANVTLRPPEDFIQPLTVIIVGLLKNIQDIWLFK